MTGKKKGKYFTKSSFFNGKEIKMYSLDGIIWSTRQWELEKILERHEAQRVTLDPATLEKEETEGGTAEVKAVPLEEDDLGEIIDIVEDVPAPKAAKGKAGRPAAAPAKVAQKSAPAKKKSAKVSPRSRGAKPVKKNGRDSLKRKRAA